MTPRKKPAMDSERKGGDFDIIGLLKRIAGDKGRMEVVYVSSLLLDALFEQQFGGVTKLVQSIDRTSEKALKSEAGAGLGGIIAKLFLDLKASITAEGKIGEQTKTFVEKELTLQGKIRLCEASLEIGGLVVDNPPTSSVDGGKYLRLVDVLLTIASADEAGLNGEFGNDAANVIRARWKRDQSLTPNSPQVVLAGRMPFPMAAIVAVQSGLQGSTYIAYPPPPPAHRSVLAEPLSEDAGITFLKTYWVVDKRSH
jgi:hypothetical protein